MGQQCQGINHEEDYIQGFSHKYEQDDKIKTGNEIPKDIKVLKSFPPISKKIKQVERKLDIFTNIIPVNGKVYQLEDKSIFSGTLKKGKMSGIGKLLLRDGTLVQSDFLNNKMNGKTRIIRPNGQYFEGKTKNNGRSSGIVFENQVLYEGNLLFNRPHGQGKQIGSGYTFEGQYEEGKKVLGKLEWNPSKNLNCVYEGGFKDDLFYGQGVLVNKQGRYEGQFSLGKKHGRGKLKYRNNQVYEGQFSKNDRHGIGKLINPDGQILFIGEWKYGKKVLSTN